MRVRFVSVSLCFVSVVALASTAVGHPVPTGFAAGDDLVFTSGELPVSTIVFDNCDTTYDTFDVYATLDPVDNDTIVLDNGTICGIRLNLSGRVKLDGTGPSGSSFSLSLGVGHIDMIVDPPIYVPSSGVSGGTFIRLAATDWITADLLDLDPNEFVSVGANHPLHDQLRDAIRYDSNAW